MPELPDVQVFKEYLDATSLHKRIRDVDVAAAGLLEGTTSKRLQSSLKGHELASTRRHGKNLFVRVTADGWLRLHFGMTGELRYFKVGGIPQHARLRVDFSNGYHLVYINVRRLGRISLVHDVDAFLAREDLGPDAMALDFGSLRATLKGRRGAIKSTLMNQSVIAGIGNVYADETLFAAGVHPQARTEDLTEGTLGDLSRAMHKVLREAIAARVDPERFPASFLLPNRVASGECPRCGSKLKRTKVSGRSTYYCARDQKRRS